MSVEARRWQNEIHRIERFIRAEGMIPDQSRILLAVSGGVDSMTLAHILLDLAPRHGWTLFLGHVNHGLRAEQSDGDEALVRRVADEYGLACRVSCWDGPSGGNLQDEARSFRYQCLVQWAKELDCEVIVTAHHADDQAETVLDRLLRGAGFQGLSALRKKNGAVVRPLLHTSRTTLEAMAGWRGVPFREDASNQSLKYTRNRLRHQVLPLLEEVRPQAGNHLANLASLAHAADEEFLRLLEEDEAHFCHWEPGLVRLPWDVMESRGVMRRLYLWRHLAQRLAAEWVPGYQEMMTLDQSLIQSEPGMSILLGGRFRAERVKDQLVFSCEQSDPTEVCRLEPGRWVSFMGWSVCLESSSLAPEVFHSEACMKKNHEGVEYFDTDTLVGELILRVVKEGESLELPAVGHKTLRDLLRDAGIPPSRRRNHPVLCDEKGILWLVGLRRAKRGLISNNTKSVRGLRWKKDAPFG